ncbi:MAG: DUF6268 family outer membrane beta-barrel protein [Myxococcota bacterium]
MRTAAVAIGAILSLVPSLATAQDANGIGIVFERVSKTAVQDTDDQELGYGDVRANAIAPIELKSWNAILLPGAAYRLYRPRPGDPEQAVTPEALHDLALRLGILKRLDNKWSLLLSASIGVATDFNEFEADHLRYQGIALATYQLSDAWALGFGGAFSYWFGDPRLLPTAQLRYRGGDWAVDAILPRFASARYSILDDFEVGALAQIDGNQFSIGQDLPFDSVRLSIADAGLVTGIRINGPLWLTVYGGATLLRRFDFLDDDNDELFNLDQDPGPIFRVGVVIRPEQD